MPHSRRNFLKTGAAAALAGAASRRLIYAAPPSAAATPALDQFGYGEVELLEGPLRSQFDANHAAYSALNEDSLLKPFRQRAGLPAPGEDMGGWYSWAPLEDLDKPGNNGFAPCHSFGQYLSASCPRLRRHRRSRHPGKSPPASSVTSPRPSAKTSGTTIAFPAYTYDKICIGLIDAHTLAGAPGAFAALDRTLDSVQKHLPPGGISRAEQYARPHRDESFCWDEPYTLAENAFLAWQRGAGPRYRELAIHFLPDSWYFDPLARGENVLPGKHAYSHVNCMSSAAQAYINLGDEKYLRAARNGFEFLRTTQSFATGGWGPDETFRAPGSGEIGESLAKTHSSFETPCGSYAHFKITRYLIRLHPRQPLRRQHGARALQLHPWRAAAEGGRPRVLLLRLQRRRLQVLPPLQMALLHRHVLADYGGLRHQRVFS